MPCVMNETDIEWHTFNPRVKGDRKIYLRNNALNNQWCNLNVNHKRKVAYLELSLLCELLLLK